VPANNIPYKILWVQEDERRTRIVNPAEKKSWMQQRLNLDFKVIDHQRFERVFLGLAYGELQCYGAGLCE
jgi:hypothetical protein